MTRSGGARLAAVLRRVGALAVGVLAACVVAEYGARFVFQHVAAADAPEATAASHVSEPQITTNSLGFREREIGPKDPARFRIAVIGDSFTFGGALEERDRYSNVLGDLLGPRFEVLNFGVAGNRLPQHLAALDPVLKLAPDFVLLQMYINNFETPAMERPHPRPLLPGDLDRDLLNRWVVYRLLSDRWTQFQEAVGLVDTYDSYMARHLRNPEAPAARETSETLRQFFVKARAAGVPSGAVLFAATDAMGPYGANYPFGYLHDHVKGVCARERVPCLDLLPMFSALADPHSTWVSPLDAHPNAQTNRRAASEMLAAFGPVWREGAALRTGSR